MGQITTNPPMSPTFRWLRGPSGPLGASEDTARFPREGPGEPLPWEEYEFRGSGEISAFEGIHQIWAFSNEH